MFDFLILFSIFASVCDDIFPNIDIDIDIFVNNRVDTRWQ